MVLFCLRFFSFVLTSSALCVWFSFAFKISKKFSPLLICDITTMSLVKSECLKCKTNLNYNGKFKNNIKMRLYVHKNVTVRREPLTFIWVFLNFTKQIETKIQTQYKWKSEKNFNSRYIFKFWWFDNFLLAIDR